MATDIPTEPPVRASPRFELELEFVGALGNISYLQYLNFHFPTLFQSNDSNHSAAQRRKKAKKSSDPDPDDNSDAAKFARYLKYLLYWKQPEYAQYLTHPAGTIRNLELLQIEQFRKDIFRPELNVRLEEGFTGRTEKPEENAAAANPNGEEDQAAAATRDQNYAPAIAT